MKKLVLVLVAAAVVLLVPTGEAVACNWCSQDAPRCEPANYRRCAAYPKLLMCDEVWANCAWVYNAEEVSADGSLATYASSTELIGGREATPESRGCHGLITERNPSAERIATIRGTSGRIVI